MVGASTDYSSRAREMMFEAVPSVNPVDHTVEHKENDDSYDEGYAGEDVCSSREREAAAAFVSAQQSSKSALEFAAVSEQEKQALRLDLSAYLTDMSEKKGSDGEALVHVPSNFDEVADSMSRADLMLPPGIRGGPAAAGGGDNDNGGGSNDVPWSQYLLSRDVAFGASLEGGGQDTGRYAGVGDGDEEAAEADARLQEAMARMKLLDSRLNAATKKDLQIKHDLTSRVARGERDDDLDSEAPTSGRLSARSVASSRSGVFLTRARSDKARSVASTSNPSSPQMSARSSVAGSAVTSPAGSVGYGALPEFEAEEPALAGAGGSKKQAFIAPSKRKGGLSDDEELRLQTLMDVDEASAEWRALSSYGLSSEQRERIADIDDELAQYGHSSRVSGLGGSASARSSLDSRLLPPVSASSTDGPESEGSDAAPAAANPYADYLSEQRTAKEEGEAQAALDKHLRSTRAEPDLSGLVDVPSGPVQGAGSHKRGGALLAVPDFGSVPAQRKITSADLNNVLAYLRQHAPRAEGEEEADDDYGDADADADADTEAVSLDDDASVATIQLLAESSCTASKRDIDRLLSGLRPQVRRLADLRQSLEAVMEAVPRTDDSGVGSSGSGGSATSVQADLCGYEDDMEDIRMRYGLETAAPAAGAGTSTQAQGHFPQKQREGGTLDIKRKLERLKLSQITRKASGGAALRAEMGMGGSAPSARQAAAAWAQSEQEEDEDEKPAHPDAGRRLVI